MVYFIIIIFFFFGGGEGGWSVCLVEVRGQKGFESKTEQAKPRTLIDISEVCLWGLLLSMFVRSNSLSVFFVVLPSRMP